MDNDFLKDVPEEVLQSPDFKKQLKRLTELQGAILRQEGLVDCVKFGREILGYKDLSDDFHKDIERQLERPDRGIYPYDMILVPRGHLKTTFITITWVLWQIIKNRNCRILITTAVLDNARKMLFEIKNHIEHNAKFIEMYGNLKGDVWHTDEITIKGRTIMDKALTIEISSPEKTKTSKHYDIIVADDLVTRDNIKSVESKYGIYLYWQDLLDLLDFPNGRVITIGTRWDFDDLYSILQDKDKTHYKYFKSYVRKVIEPGADGKDRIIFPEKFTWQVINMLKDSKELSQFSAQYMNEPMSPGDATFKESYFKTYKLEELPRVTATFMAIDPAVKLSKKSDFSTCLVIKVDENNKWYIIDGFRDKLLPKDMIDKIWKMANTYNPLVVGLEEVGFQTYLKESWVDKQRKENKYFNYRELKPGGRRKEDRISALEPRFRVADILLPPKIEYKNCDNQVIDLCYVLKNELLKYRNDVQRTHDDLADVLSYFLDFAFRPNILGRRDVKPYEGKDGLSSREFTGLQKEKRGTKVDAELEQIFSQKED